MYRSKLFNIVLNHRFTNLDCADQYVVQMCPELTKFLPKGVVAVIGAVKILALPKRGGSDPCQDFLVDL